MQKFISFISPGPWATVDLALKGGDGSGHYDGQRHPDQRLGFVSGRRALGTQLEEEGTVARGEILRS